jgi:23S rRNA (pseudouridine1915-N3)-methyltransferase
VKIAILSVGARPPQWVRAGVEEYIKRMPPECRVELVEIPPGKRAKGMPAERIRDQEGERILAALPKGARVVALEVKGRGWSTEQLAGRLEDWQQEGRDVALLVGGPDGLAPSCRERADELWSLSPLTLPHMLVRIVLAEQLYRAWSITRGHPYHK